MKAPDPAGMGAAPAAGGEGARPQVELPTPPGWRSLAADQSFYLAKWETADGAVATLSWLGAGNGPDFLVQNVQRWLNEWQTPSGEAVKDYTFTSEDNGPYKMHRIGLAGTLTGVRQLGGGEPRAGWALDGVVAETPQGPLFFKLIGPAEVVAAQRDAAWAMLGAMSVR